MSIDWNRRTCARRGHLTYEPHEPAARHRLLAPTAHGDAWRCLRCGDFVPGPPAASGPAAEAPRPPRGRALRDRLILRVLAVERVLRGVFIVLAAYAVWRFSNTQDAVRDLFERDLTLLRPLAVHYHYDVDHSPVVDTIRRTFSYRPATLDSVAAALLGYALIELVEGVGLWFAKRWAEYLTVVATAAFLPLEVYELTERVSWLKIGTLVLNVLAVLYILLAKRLFGLRGGARAAEAASRGADLLAEPVARPAGEAAGGAGGASGAGEAGGTAGEPRGEPLDGTRGGAVR